MLKAFDLRSPPKDYPRGIDKIEQDYRDPVTPLPQCDAQRSHRYCGAWESSHPDKRCSLSARYRIDGKNLCARHAGEVALADVIQR